MFGPQLLSFLMKIRLSETINAADEFSTKWKPLIVFFIIQILLVVWQQNCYTGIQKCVKQIWGSELVNDPKTLMREGEEITMGNYGRFFSPYIMQLSYIFIFLIRIRKQVGIELCQAQGKLKLVWLWLDPCLL